MIKEVSSFTTQSPIQWVPGALSPVLKWPGHESKHSPPSSAEVRAIPPLPCTFHGVALS